MNQVTLEELDRIFSCCKLEERGCTLVLIYMWQKKFCVICALCMTEKSYTFRLKLRKDMAEVSWGESLLIGICFWKLRCQPSVPSLPHIRNNQNLRRLSPENDQTCLYSDCRDSGVPSPEWAVWTWEIFQGLCSWIVHSLAPYCKILVDSCQSGDLSLNSIKNFLY